MPEELDPWADFMADLGVSQPAAQTPERRETFLSGVPTGDIAEMPLDDAEGESAEGESSEIELDEDGQPKRKRRRRRRGRGRKGEPGEAGEGDDSPMPASGEPIVLEAPAAYDAEGGDYDSEESAPLAVESGDDGPAEDYGVEDASPAATRELIADWNVPSWQEIVAGLYRPER